MNNMNGIISECQHIYNSEVEIKDTKNGATRAIAFYSNAKARIAEDKEKQDSLQIEQETSKIVTGEELRRFFDRNYDMNHPIEEKEDWNKETRQLPEQDQR